jgi:hypothetical protein
MNQARVNKLEMGLTPRNEGHCGEHPIGKASIIRVYIYCERSDLCTRNGFHSFQLEFQLSYYLKVVVVKTKGKSWTRTSWRSIDHEWHDFRRCWRSSGWIAYVIDFESIGYVISSRGMLHMIFFNNLLVLRLPMWVVETRTNPYSHLL